MLKLAGDGVEAEEREEHRREPHRDFEPGEEGRGGLGERLAEGAVVPAAELEHDLPLDLLGRFRWERVELLVFHLLGEGENERDSHPAQQGPRRIATARMIPLALRHVFFR